MINKHLNNSIYKPKIFAKVRLLFTIAVLTIISLIVLNLTSEKSKISCYEKMIHVTEKMKIIYKEVADFRINKHSAIDEMVDLNKTGFIGEEFSLITTTLGNLDSKQISLNPDFTALMIKWMHQLQLTEGDSVVIHASASFPALTIMAIIACEELDLIPVIISSVGASSWGANQIDFTYLDIENHLYNKNLIKYRSSYVTPGGTNDNGSSLWEGGLEIILENASSNKYDIIIVSSLENVINQKWKIIQNIKPELFINIGGNHSALGEPNCALNLPVGLITDPINCSDEGTKGLIYKCNQLNIPVMHFLKIKEIAYTNGISLSPIFSDSASESEIYFEKRISVSIAIISFLVLFSLAFFLKRNKEL